MAWFVLFSRFIACIHRVDLQSLVWGWRLSGLMELSASETTPCPWTCDPFEVPMEETYAQEKPKGKLLEI